MLQSLQFKLAILFVLVAVVLLAVSYLVGRVLVQENLVEDTRRYQRESGLRLADGVQDRLDRARILASGVAEMMRNGNPDRWNERVPQLVEASGLGALIAGVGIWPEPRSLDKDRERASHFWVADNAGLLQPREDYNDGRAIPYWGEAWYTPARYAASGSCFWTTVFRENLSNREVVACALPLRDSRGFVGAVTVLLGVERLQTALRDMTAQQTGYALLADRDNRLIALTGVAAERLRDKPPRNLAALAQQFPSLNTLALDLHRRDEAFLSRAVQSPLYDATLISKLKDATREGSRQEAESALAAIWTNGNSTTEEVGEAAELLIADDGLLGASASATVFALTQPHWKLVRVTNAREGVAGAQYFFTQTLVVVGGGILLTLLLVFGGLRALVLRPLTAVSRRLSDARTLEESLHLQLDASARNEIGLIGHWYNERVRQLREAMDRTLSQQAQLAVEAGERARSDDQSLRLRERAAALLGSMSEAAIVVDARGMIEDMNGAAERLTNTVLRTARGRPAAEVFRARPANHAGTPPDYAAAALASNERIEQLEGLFLHVEGRGEREIQLKASALRGPSGRALGAVLVFGSKEAQASFSPKLIIDRRSVDTVTGLPTRPACDRRLRALIESTKLQPRTHAVIVADIDRLRHINETAGLRAGDEILVRMAETLIGHAPGADAFRLGADSFAVVLEATDAEGARRTANLLREALAATQFHWEDRVLSITASFGVCLFDSATEHPMELLRRADDACAAAKREGRNAVRVYEAAFDRASSSTDEATWIRRIRAGLDEGLFHLTTQWIQPSDSRIGEGAVYDVSLALEDEEGFWAEPAAFLPVAERAGLVAEVERWALRNTLEHLARNPEVVARLSFCCLPLSTSTVGDGATLELLAQLFQNNEHLPPNRICFVLGEAVLADAPGPAQTFCDAMRSLGCRVAIDHFIGRGVAAVDIIRKLPAEFLCIDARHFVDLTGDAVDQVIAESLMRLARALSRRVMVSDIQDDAAAETWKRLGADYVHGIGIARPSPVVFSANR